MLRSFVLFCLASLPVVAHADDLATSAARFHAAQKAVGAHISADGFEVESSPAAVTPLQAQWAAARDLVVALLDRDPTIAPGALARQAKRSAGIVLDALRLDPETVLVDADSGQFGTVFLLHRAADGHYRPAFSLDAPLATRDARMPELDAWQPAQGGGDCQDKLPFAQWSRCGPLAVERLIRLPNESGGARRFAILAVRVAAAGGTARHQISIWRWDGRIATPLLTRTLFQVITDPVFAGQDARGFTLHANEDYASLNVCGECAGRRMIWRFDLPSTGARAPRIHSVSPELDLVDRFYTRLFAHRPADDLAARPVVARLSHVELDMLNRWRYLGSSGGARSLCVDAMGFDRPQIFRIVRRRGKLWIAAVTFAHPHACDGHSVRS